MSLQKLAAQFGFDIDAKSVDAAIKSVNSIDKQFGQLGRSADKFIGLLGAGGIGAGIFAFAKSSVDAFAKEETAILKLQNALDNIGVTDKSVTADLIAFAKATQLTTMATDEEIIAIQTTLIQRGLWGEALKQAVKDSINLASKTGDLAGAANVVGASFQGVTRGLRQFGIAIDTHMPKAQIFEAVHKQINEHFAGAAQAQMAGYAGHLHVMTVEMDELKKRMGEQMEPIFLFWIDKFKIILDDIDKLGEKASKSGGNVYQSALPGLQKQLDTLNASAASYSNYQAKVPAALQQQIDKMEKVIEQTKRYEAAKNTPADPGSNKPTKGIAEPGLGIDADWQKALRSFDQQMLSERGQLYTQFFGKQAMDAKRSYIAQAANAKEMGDREKEVLEKLKTDYENASHTISGGWSQALNEMNQKSSNWKANFTQVMNLSTAAATTAIHNFVHSSGNEFNKLGKLADDMFNGILNAFEQVLEQMAARAAIYGIFSMFASPEGSLLKFMGFAEGGSVPGPKGQQMPALVHGGEYVLPAGVVDAIKRGQSPSMASVGAGAGGGGVNITQNITLSGSGGASGDIGKLCLAISEATRNGLRQAGEMANVITKVGTRKAGITGL